MAARGFEPLTSSFQSWRSTNSAMPPVWEWKIVDGGTQIAIRWSTRDSRVGEGDPPSRLRPRGLILQCTAASRRNEHASRVRSPDPTKTKNAGRLLAIRHFD